MTAPAKGDNMNQPARLLTRPQAAAYCGAAPSTFSMWVAAGKMPPPVPGMKRWDRQAIDDKLDALRGIAANDNQETPLEKWKRERDARKAKGA